MKPHIEAVFAAFQNYQAKIQSITANRSPGTWEVLFSQAREEFKRTLEELGIAQHIDWEDSR